MWTSTYPAPANERPSGRRLAELEHVPLQVNPPRHDEEEDGGERGEMHLGLKGRAKRSEADRLLERYTSATKPAATTTSQSSSADTKRSNGSEKTKYPTSLP